MIDYTFKEIIAIGAELLLDTRKKAGVPEDIQALYGNILRNLNLSEAELGVLKDESEAEYEFRLEEFTKQARDAQKESNNGQFGYMEDFE